MRQGFLLNERSGSTIGPLHDDRSSRNPAAKGWGASSATDVNSDPWVDRIRHFVTAGASDPIELAPPTNATNNATDENPYRNKPSPPYKTSREPMNALGCYYSHYYHTTHLKMSDYYFSWSDGNPKSHLLLWTSVFVCPLSGEIFLSGEWPGNDVVLKPTNVVESTRHIHNLTKMNVDESIITSTPVTTQQIRWMKKKKVSEHGAAAWAYDCFQHRHKQSAVVHRSMDNMGIYTLLSPKNDICSVNITSSIGSEVPYMEDTAIRMIPAFVPETIKNQIERRLIEIQNDTTKSGENGDNVDMEEELAWRSTRPPPNAS
jgi:hypothetical protein